jgi:hypothetical protein
MPPKKTIIDELISIDGLKIECPKCGEAFSPKAATI